MSTVLVVDDMAVFREPIAAVLRVHRFDVQTAADGKEALAKIAQQRPDLILLDVAMPVMDGLAVLRALRGNPQLRQIPVILLTAVAERDYVKEAAQLGIQDYLLKSHFSLEDLVSRIRKRLDPASAPRADVVVGPLEAKAEAKPAAANGVRPAVSAASPGVAVAAAAPPPKAPAGAGPIAVPPPRTELIDKLTPIITREDMLKIVAEGLALRPLAPAVQNVMAVTANPRCSAEDVAKAVSQDQALCVRVLKLANGSMYSRGTPVDSLRTAVGRLGSREIRNMVMTLGVLQRYEGRISEYMDARMFWEHSAACGLIAADVAKRLGQKNIDDYFLWGLLHDVGRLVLIENLPDKYGEVCETARKLGVPLDRVEGKMLALDHCSILEKAQQHWRFPEEFVMLATNHHQSAANLKRLPAGHMQTTAVVAFADRLAKALLLGSSGNDVLQPYDDVVEMLGLNTETLEELAASIPYETDSLKFGLLARVSEGPWAGAVEMYKSRLRVPLRPLCVAPRASAVDLFFRRFAGSMSAGTPNCSIVNIPDPRQQLSLLAAVEAKERESKCGRLPLLIVVDRGQVDTALEVIAHRRYAIVKPPVRLDVLFDTINELLPPG